MRGWLDRRLVIAGVLVGALNLVFYLLVSPKVQGQSAGLSVGGPVATGLAWVEDRSTGAIRAFRGVPPVAWALVPGILLGALVSAILGRRLTWRAFRASSIGRRWPRALSGGLLVGFGVLLADGCLVKHALTGLPGGSLESVSVLLGILAGIWCAMKVEERFEP